VNWRGVMAPAGIGAEDKKVLEDTIRKMTESEAWKKILEQREWVSLYMPSAEFAAFVKDEQTRIGALLKDLGLA
jgi:putative tricarboxylic transport membrane protein